MEKNLRKDLENQNLYGNDQKTEISMERARKLTNSMERHRKPLCFNFDCICLEKHLQSI